jgi:hypothetical protein
MEAPPEPAQSLRVGRDVSLRSPPELVVDRLGEEDRADEDYRQQPDPGRGERARGPSVR